MKTGSASVNSLSVHFHSPCESFFALFFGFVTKPLLGGAFPFRAYHPLRSQSQRISTVTRRLFDLSPKIACSVHLSRTLERSLGSGHGAFVLLFWSISCDSLEDKLLNSLDHVSLTCDLPFDLGCFLFCFEKHAPVTSYRHSSKQTIVHYTHL